MKSLTTNKILALIEKSPDGILLDVAQRAKQRRLELNLTQEGLAVRADVPFSTYRRFESTGEISLRNLVKLGFALRSIDGFDSLFDEPRYESLAQMRKQKQAADRQRGRRNE